MTGGEFIKSVTTKSESEIRHYVDSTYAIFENINGKSVGFGPEGCNEFVASIFLAEHDRSTVASIHEAICKVFEGSFSPLDFSNQMDSIVSKSNIPYEAWSSIFRFLKSNHMWLKDHPCGALHR